ncbi:MAG: tetratricopeptide repeat protein, partial [Gammaproteobacteria bacterium]|jgi:tetratricopeptide (TPR) repeat protein|nr:tetratricopeptide repeat protein [Gammaproteobacteria bacterium]
MRILIFTFLLLGVSTNSLAEQDNSPVNVSSGSGASAQDQPQSGTPQEKPSSDKAGRGQSVTFKSLKQMDELIDLGMPALALNLLEDEQIQRPAFSADWYAFEYKRILLLSALERWQQVIERTQWLFDTAAKERHITKKIRLWFETQQVIARLQLKQSEQALEQLQHLLWDTDEEHRDPSLPVVWRRLVIRAYLQSHVDDDARRALVKYERDYKTEEQNIDWVLLQAQVMLRTNRPQQAIQLLEKIPLENAVDVEALLLIAQLQHDPKKAATINQQMREKLDGQLLNRSARWAYSYVAYLCSKILNDQAAQISNLESMLSLGIETPVFDESYQVTADDLWGMYNEQGLILANDSGLLFGNDEQWQKRSDQLLKKAPEKALALNTALVLHTNDFSTMQQQHKTIVEIIEQRKNGLELINQLYLHSDKVQDVNVLPDEVRYRLVDYALSEGDYSEAARIMKSLQEPPPGNTLFDWRMRKARVLILQGEYQSSEDLIRKTFSENARITRDELDRYIQVVFDFQTVQQHERAIRLFDIVSLDGLDEKLKREIYFWKAESYFSLEEYDRAALFYLESSRAVVDAEHDLWGQSARFKAGQALMQAEIYDDAKKVFSDLLLVTVSDSRKAIINQNLQKIRLLKSAAKNKQT